MNPIRQAEMEKLWATVESLRPEAERGRVSTHPDNLRLRQGELLNRIKEIVSGNDWDGDRALLAVGQLREAMRAFDEPAQAIKKYEAARKSLDDLRKGLEADA
jgi:hypothetical protein